MKNRSIIDYSLYFTVFVFWAFIYSNHILFTEQLSLFLYVPEYWKQYALQPGGWSVYCGNFLAQFYISRWAGALIQTLLCAALLILSKRILMKMDIRGNLLLAHILPALLLLVLQCDYRFTTGNTLALICPFALTLLFMNMQRTMVRRLVFTLLIIPVYLFSGAVATCCLYAACMFFELLRAKDKWKYATLVWLFVMVALPHMWQAVYLMPDNGLFQAIDYQLDESVRFVSLALLAWIPLCVLSVRFISQQRLTAMTSSKGTMVTIVALLLTCGFYLFPKTCNRAEEQMLRMYLAAVQNNWDRVLETGKRAKNPEQCTNCLINLALAMKGELSQKMFNYPQSDEYGLLPEHTGDFFYLCCGSLFFYHIGIPNEAIRWIFDSYILRSRGNMDYHTLTRLAKWNRENGYEQVASKYFDILNHTLMYHSWSKRQRETPLPQREESVDYPVEFYVGSHEPLSDLRLHYENYPQNTMVLDYLLCCLLLKNDPSRFLNLYNTFYQSPKEMPKVYQEALLLIVNMGGTVDIRNYPIDKININKFFRFIDLVEKRNDKELEKQFGDTWWYYSYQKMNPKTKN